MRPAILFAVLALSACARPAPPDRVYAVFFNETSDALDAVAAGIVDRAAATAMRYPGRVVHVIGYADSNGTPAATVQLSKRRADVVSARLVGGGVPVALIEQSAGGTPGSSQPGVERRRVEIDVDVP